MPSCNQVKSILTCVPFVQDGAVVYLSKSRAGEDFIAVFEWGVIVIQGLLSPGGKSYMVIVFWEDLLYVGSVKISQNNERSLWV